MIDLVENNYSRMKLKLVIDGFEQPEDYKLLQSTFSTVSSLREKAVLRFTKERLIIISSPKISGNGSDNVNGNNGQLWCTIPRDVFKLYFVESMKNIPISLEFNCNRVLSVLKQYDKALAQGSITCMDIRLQEAREWQNTYSSTNNLGDDGDGDDETTQRKKRRLSPIYSFTMRFQETIRTHTNGPGKNNNGGIDEYDPLNKTVTHKFMIPVKRLYTEQDASLREPVIRISPLVLRLPSSHEEFGRPFQNFIRRIERYNNIKEIQLNAVTFRGGRKDPELSISVNQPEWDLFIQWNGPLDVSYDPANDDEEESADPISTENKGLNVTNGMDSTNSNNNSMLPTVPLDKHDDKRTNVNIDDDVLEDSEILMTAPTTESHTMQTKAGQSRRDRLKEISHFVERAEEENMRKYSIKVRPRDWKVCTKLYSGFNQVLLAIAHDQCGVFHCSLDRDSEEAREEKEDETPSNEGPGTREKGQIVYYMLKSKSL